MIYYSMYNNTVKIETESIEISFETWKHEFYLAER